jgi:hypothetical protein
MFWGGWKISFLNSVSSIMISYDKIHTNYGFDEYMKDVELEKEKRK